MLSVIQKWGSFVRFSHTIFALPFALAAMVVAARQNQGWPGWRICGLILAAMVCARTCAMAFNRIVDRKFDALNPRTAKRHLATGEIRLANAIFLCALAWPLAAQAPAVRTADPIKRGLKESDFPRTIKVSDNVYTYEDFHAGDEKFTTTNMFVVTDAGVLVADGQGSPRETKGLVDAIAKITPQPIKYVVVASDHGDHTAGNASFPAGVIYIIHPTAKAILDRADAGRGGSGW